MALLESLEEEEEEAMKVLGLFSFATDSGLFLV